MSLRKKAGMKLILKEKFLAKEIFFFFWKKRSHTLFNNGDTF